MLARKYVGQREGMQVYRPGIMVQEVGPSEIAARQLRAIMSSWILVQNGLHLHMLTV